MSDLKPCPFCGGEATVRSSGYLYRAVCDTCGSEGSYATKDIKAAKAWNTRHVETCTIGDYKDSDYGYTHTAMWNDEWFMPSGICSGCGEYIPVMNYCPSCGRKVEG